MGMQVHDAGMPALGILSTGDRSGTMHAEQCAWGRWRKRPGGCCPALLRRPSAGGAQ